MAVDKTRSHSTMMEFAIEILKAKDEYSPNERLNALKFVVKQYEETYIQLFEELLSDESEHPDIRSSAAMALGKKAGKNSLKTLLAYSQNENPTLRKYVMDALGMTESEDAVPALIEALSDSDNQVFFSASDALGRMGKKALPQLINLLKSSDDAEDARCVAAWKLGELGDANAVVALVEVVNSDNNTELLALCLWALGEIGEFSNDVMDALTRAKSTDIPDISMRAERALKKIARHMN